jgi:hypothetical protein
VPIEPAPAGARGGVLEIRDDGMIEVMTMPLESRDRPQSPRISWRPAPLKTHRMRS